MYLILDTNIWIYLANGFNPDTNHYEEGLHFKLLESLKRLVSSGQITILTNQVILDEWGRNKAHRYESIEKLKRGLVGQVNGLKNMKRKLDQSDAPLVDSLVEKLTTKTELEITNNEKHVQEVEDLLHNYTSQYLISTETKLNVLDWAVKKNAPFKGDKSNSTADALILFGAIDYLKGVSLDNSFGEPIYLYTPAVFVSSNTGDFSDTADKTKLHPDLVPLVSSIKMEYGINLGHVLNDIEKIFENSEVELIEEEIEEFNQTYCEVCDPDEDTRFFATIDFDGPMEIESGKNSDLIDPSQMRIFPNDDKPAPRTYSIELGTCGYCDQEYLRCGQCNTINVVDDEYVQCEDCGEIYKRIDDFEYVVVDEIEHE